MNLNWFFHKKTAGWLGLECPNCSNNRIFEGIACQERLIWKCLECGNYLYLNLKPVDETVSNCCKN